MPFSPTGVFTPLVTFVDGTDATAEDQNSQDVDIAGGLTQCMTLAGLAAATANIPMGGFKLTGLGSGSANGDSVNYGQLTSRVSSAMVPVTSAVSIAAALTALGGTTVGVGVFEAASTILGLGALGIVSGVATALQGATTTAVYANLGGAITAPNGRLTLTTATPYLSAAVIAATSILFTPVNGNQAPLWNGTAWTLASFTELSCLLSDSTKSPAGAVAASCYDLFIWQSSGTWVLSRGPVWTNVTTRSAGTQVSRIAGFLSNSVTITNGPAAGYGLYVGTIATDTGGATVTFNPIPAAASGGPATVGAPAGSWIGFWNEFNRIVVGAVAQDSKSSWTDTTTSYRAADGSNNNRITHVSGESEDTSVIAYDISAANTGSGAGQAVGIGVNSVTVASVANPSQLASTNVCTMHTAFLDLGFAGQRYWQALEVVSSGTATFYGTSAGALGSTTSAQSMQLSAQLRY